MSDKLLMIVNEDRFFLSHRKEIALAAQKAGWDVTVVCKDTGQRNEVERMGQKGRVGLVGREAGYWAVSGV